MEYNPRKMPCQNGADCYYLRKGYCKFQHPQDHKNRLLSYNSNHQNHIIPQWTTNHHGLNYSSTNIPQYPNDPAIYAPQKTQNYKNSCQNNRSSQGYFQQKHNQGHRKYQKYSENSQHQNQNRHQGKKNQKMDRKNQIRTFQDRIQVINRERSREWGSSNNLSPQNTKNESSQYRYQRGANFKRQERQSPQYISRPYNYHRKNQNQPYQSQVKPEKNQNQIKMNFSNSQPYKMQEQTENYHFNNLDRPELQEKLHQLFRKKSQNIDLENFLNIAKECRDRITLTRQQQQRRLRQNRQFRQSRKFYNNSRIMEENHRMIERNRIQQDRRDRYNRDFPQIQQEQLQGPVESTSDQNNINQPNLRQYFFNLQFNPFDDDYGEQFQQNIQNDQFQAEINKEINEENFDWFVNHCKFIDGSQLSLQQAQKLEKCPICLYEFSDLVQSGIIQNGQNMIMQLYCHQKHIFHKSCGVDWLKKQLNDVNKAYCPICRQDFRDHKAFAQYDPQYRQRLIPVRHHNQQLYQSSANQEDIFEWQEEVQRFNNLMRRRRRNVYFLDQRMRYLIERIERNETERLQRQQRRRTRRIVERVQSDIEIIQQTSTYESRQENQQRSNQIHHTQSIDSNHSVSQMDNWVYSSQSQSPQLNSNRQMNSQQQRRFWQEYWQKQPQSNPFQQKSNQQLSQQKNNLEQK